MDFKKMLNEEADEMLRYKYLESEKAGRDLGDECMVKWPPKHGEAFRVGYYQRNMMDLGDGKKPVYFGIFLDGGSRDELIARFGDLVPEGWRMVCHHCTISFGDPSDDPEVFEFLARNLGKTVEMEVASVGISEKAIALGVKGNFRSKNAVPHITLAVPPDGKPANSNKIENWRGTEPGCIVTGVVDAFPSHFGWKH